MARRLVNEIEVRDHGMLATRPIEGLLRSLADVHASPHGVITLYIDARWDDEQQRERARLTIKTALAEARDRLAELPREQREPIERDLARAVEYAALVIEQRRDVGFEAVAAFFCEARGLDLVALWHDSVPTALSVGAQPVLLPLVRCANDFDVALVAVVESDETRIFEVSLGGLLSEDVVASDVPDRVVRGGWRQLRIQKHIADQILHHHREAARDVTARFDGITAQRGRPPRVVLGGRPPMLAAFERNLPERILAHAIPAPQIDPKAATDEVMRHVLEALSEAARRRNREALAAVRDAAAMGRGALGIDAVLAAVNGGRLRDVLVHRGFDAEGRCCERCDMLTAQTWRSACPACAGKLAPVNLLDEIARRAVLSSAEIHMLDGDQDLRQLGIAAALRF
jgi:peptide chain release factor subunit 1